MSFCNDFDAISQHSHENNILHNFIAHLEDISYFDCIIMYFENKKILLSHNWKFQKYKKYHTDLYFNIFLFLR